MKTEAAKMSPLLASATSTSSPNPNHKRAEPCNIVTLNVGGQLFQTTPQTLALAGPNSLLSSSSPSSTPFIDRDPDAFSALLSLLRTGRLPSRAAAALDPDDLLAEARFYGLHPLLQSALHHHSLFDAFALRPSLLLPLPGRDPPSALAPSPDDASLLVAHGGKVSSFDPSLRRRATALTPLPVVDSLLALGPLAAAGAADFPGLHLLDLRRPRNPVRRVLSWCPHPSDPAAAAVQAVGSSPDLLFCSFESCRRNASSILAFDLATFQLVAEISRREVYGAELDSAIPATKLQWASGLNLLMAAGSHGGPSGLLGDVRLWDVRSGKAVWDLKEKVDCFADVTVSDGLSAMFKVGIYSGKVYMADIRKLSSEEPWVCIGFPGRDLGTGKKEGSGCRIESHGRHVFCSRGGHVEMWTEVLMGPSSRTEDGLESERVMRRNLMGGATDLERKKINLLKFGGNRMVVARKDEQCVEVWESSSRG